MRQTSDVRRDVAEQLRMLRHITYYREEVVENICDAINIADPVNTFREPEDIYECLADLIDPTCNRVSMDAAGNPPFKTGGLALNDVTGGCSKCGYPFGNSNARIGNPFNAPNYCPNCGSRLVSADDAS
jgi:hypothetical protein